ncbi:Aste57867_2809 [Aphanomyces stellatus]|uniref:Aste57867_2809 protein n=1 Tax=Aphanomyces stellatus TaxID=120398 RepID=A0A485KC43_9STRA|nr:hypothetical protein As57867_002802 [Aphanomyces stellatus]VFT79998.1 Aste57867_2809 [Aphanomyces stellatus]
MKRSCPASSSLLASPTNMKRSHSCMDLAALESEIVLCPKKRLTMPPRYRSLSSGPTSRGKNLEAWLQAYDMKLGLPVLEAASIEDVLSSATSSSSPFGSKKTDDSVQMELIDLLQQAWIDNSSAMSSSSSLLKLPESIIMEEDINDLVCRTL